MKPETKKEIKDTMQTIAIAIAVMATVFVFHNSGNDKNKKHNEKQQVQNTIKTDSVRTDSIPSLSFVQEQMRQQKTR